MKIQTVALIGAGAIGSYFISGLSDKLGGDLWTIADGERAERLRKGGLVINGKKYALNVRSPKEAHGADLIIVTVKYTALPGILDDIAAIVDDHTIILSPLNGVDSEEIIAKAVGAERIVYSLMKVVIRRIGNETTFNAAAATGILFGEKDGSLTPRTAAIDELFNGSGVRHTLRTTIIQDKWYKYALNVSRNLPQAILNCGFEGYVKSENVDYISKKMRAEVVAVAAAKGIDISDPNNPIGRNQKNLSDARFSTLQDLDAKRPTEIDMFSGALVRMGKELGVPTPFNDFALHAIKALEEKNAGLFS